MVETIRHVSFYKMIIGALIFGISANFYAQEKGLDAQRAYQQGLWDTALTLYESINPKTRAVWYNLGNVHYQKENYPQAIICWKKAYKSSSSTELAHIDHNIACALKKMGLPCRNRYSVYAMFFSFPILIVQLFFLLVWYLLALIIFLRKRLSALFLLFSAGILMIATILGGTLLILEYKSCSEKTGVVVSKVVSVYAGPDEKYHVLGVVNEMDDVAVHEQRSGWYKINTRIVRGWVPANAIRLI